MAIYDTAWNYLRVRGEYRVAPSTRMLMPELPPRARRIQEENKKPVTAGGTTSACAENTAGRAGRGRRGRNYLRVRGEYKLFLQPASLPMELPPRARRIP